MMKNQNIDYEAINLREEDRLDRILTEEEYLIQVLNSVSEIFLPDHLYDRNKFLIRNITNDFCNRHSRHGDMPPALAGKCIETFFSSIAKFGFR